MKSHHTHLLGAILTLPFLPVNAQASHCSNASTAGNWAYTYTGTIFTPGGALPLASVGHYTQDAAGNIIGSQNRSVGGSSGIEDVSGTVTVNADCTATGTIDVLVDGQLQRTAVLAVVYDSNGNHARMIFRFANVTGKCQRPSGDYARCQPVNDKGLNT